MRGNYPKYFCIRLSNRSCASSSAFCTATFARLTLLVIPCIYCTAKYFNDFEKAMIAAVNHKGDSDSTGAVTGNMLGAAIGYDAIPKCYKDNLELHDVILHVADDLWRGETTKM